MIYENLGKEEMMDRFQKIWEYINPSAAPVIDEAGDDKNENDGPQGGDMPPMGGPQGGPDAQGGDMPPMGGPQGGPDAQGGDMPPMGGPQGGPDAQGGDMPPMGGQQGGPQGFNPQEGGEEQPQGGMPDDGGMPPMGDEGNGPEDPSMDGVDQMQPDDEVLDVTELTDSQEETEQEIQKMGGKFDKALKAIGAFEKLLQSQNDKIEDLKAELEKRNPTPMEKLSMQTAHSYPFNITPDDYWKQKEATSNYRTESDNNGVGEPQYTITKNDVSGNDWKNISDSFDDDDDSFMYNQTLNKILSM